MKAKDIIRVSSKGQIVLPKRYRDKMGIREGDYICIHEVDKGVLLVEKLSESPLDVIAADLRREAQSRGITREDIAAAIKEVRARHLPKER